jgi:hypothetical protein
MNAKKWIAPSESVETIEQGKLKAATYAETYLTLGRLPTWSSRHCSGRNLAQRRKSELRGAIQLAFPRHSPDRSRNEIGANALQRTCISGCGTNDRNTDKGEVGGSSPPRPLTQYLWVILAFPSSRPSTEKAICQKFAKNPGDPI